MKVTSISCASTVQKGRFVLTTLLHNLREKTFLESSLVLLASGFQWKNVAMCQVACAFRAGEMPPRGSGFLLENNQKGVLRFSLFLSLSSILQLLCRVSEGEAKGKEHIWVFSGVAQAAEVPEGS